MVGIYRGKMSLELFRIVDAKNPFQLKRRHTRLVMIDIELNILNEMALSSDNTQYTTSLYEKPRNMLCIVTI